MHKLHFLWLAALLAVGATSASANVSLLNAKQCSAIVFASDSTTSEEDVVVVVEEEEEEPDCD